MKRLSDEFLMKLAIKEAKKGLGYTSPNPVVGAVLVDPITQEVIARGYHQRYGGPHAEVVAIEKAKGQTQGAILYVTLEPCNHYGKTPPCTQKILSSGIKKVVCGIRDPNPIAKGGLEFLSSKGIEVKTGVLEKEVKILTRFFLSRVLRKRPWVLMKVAASLDGKIAISTGDSKWITGEEARKYTHKLRGMFDAILVGKNTVLKDDPLLTCRLNKGKNPIRIILDTHLSLNLDYKVFKTLNEAQTIVACQEKVPSEKVAIFEKAGVILWKLPLKEGQIDLKALMEKCLEFGINSLMVEGGAKVHGSFLKERLVDEVCYMIGPLIIGDKEGIPAVEGKPLKCLKEAIRLHEVKVKRLGDSYMFHGYTEEGLRLIETPLR
ncbi:bifunctional diaminohydroxyphosphoribosylaminopyrimidine deaminase/5-amino-6-(5-phosphoribosylamino)uracil reductase RibD [Thermodesulfobacterium sp. TA1]|uniref:bifunctional diaminohydroxyphosphoribosylaminopyrimidine deaminase/5-amino-6-(5-phosphoribosylamino)uracil reductase RibD n=1 Tax=Thermodesulfobacterium sp. TA1 TaxID=2234087 RepID=UPI001232F0A7|nr:bifunctional diaminohydroxyphosphoribosylaminopyrimidine deaminase/5-amino-6-(5-phosphoribosylamino)uracil reductase RibD [Thermodesulfobacterium sp. TA1]QER41390.1 bifunctional diaminohydroxyphosphoribosylaminopyrimidine deaminase/5-amino-6-(5-phosphoribosylamino)uracil reductase RibD [Thermodesulfobacterium sp. TA1]